MDASTAPLGMLGTTASMEVTVGVAGMVLVMAVAVPVAVVAVLLLLLVDDIVANFDLSNARNRG